MADDESNEFQEEADALKNKVGSISLDLPDTPYHQLNMSGHVGYLAICWADFHLFIVEPKLEHTKLAAVIEPDFDEKKQVKENVYPIFDFGDLLSSSRAEDMAKCDRSTAKYLNTVEKMVRLAIAKVGDTDTDPQVTFDGHIIGQRKAYEAVATLHEKMVVRDFPDDAWADQHIKNVETLYSLGFKPKA